MGELPFDVIVLDTKGGQERLSVTQFLARPLRERVRLILEGRLTFLRGEREVERSECLQSLALAQRLGP